MSIRIRIERNDWKVSELIYEDGSCVLNVGLDLSATGSGGWLAVGQSFAKWSFPEGESISDEKRGEILNHINEWAKNNDISIIVTKGITKKELITRFNIPPENFLTLDQVYSSKGMSPPPKKKKTDSTSQPNTLIE